VGYANNLPAYQGADGYFYSWSGTTMSPLTGQLVSSGGQVANVQGGAVVPNTTNLNTTPLPSLTSNTQAGISPYASSAPSGAYTPTSTPLPTLPSGGAAAQPVAAGVDTSALPPWLTWGAVAGVVGLMFMTARPAPRRGGYRSAPRPVRYRPVARR
jgi:hypothetical protein